MAKAAMYTMTTPGDEVLNYLTVVLRMLWGRLRVRRNGIKLHLSLFHWQMEAQKDLEWKAQEERC